MYGFIVHKNVGRPMKILLMIFLLPITVYAAAPLFGSASATIENRKGIYVFSTEEPVIDGLTSTLDSGADSTELFSTPDYELIVEDPEPTLVFDSEENLIVDEPDAEERDLADTLLSDEVREE